MHLLRCYHKHLALIGPVQTTSSTGGFDLGRRRRGNEDLWSELLNRIYVKNDDAVVMIFKGWIEVVSEG